MKPNLPYECHLLKVLLISAKMVRLPPPYCTTRFIITYKNRENLKIPFVPSEDDIKKYYEAVLQAQRTQDVIIIKLLLYTEIRVRELIRLKSDDVNLNDFTVKIAAIKRKKDRLVPFPKSFRKTLAMQIEKSCENNQLTLFCSLRKQPFSDRGIRRMVSA